MPEKELRFTRQNQALFFGVIAGLLGSVSVLLLTVTLTVFYAEGELKGAPLPWWLALLPLLPMSAALYAGWYCLRHPYLLLSPVGIELFPFWRPIKNYRLIQWGHLASVEFPSERCLILHFDEKKSAGVVLSLNPIHKRSRTLLKQALEGVFARRLEKAPSP